MPCGVVYLCYILDIMVGFVENPITVFGKIQIWKCSNFVFEFINRLSTLDHRDRTQIVQFYLLVYVNIIFFFSLRFPTGIEQNKAKNILGRKG